MSKILVLCPTQRDYREIAELNDARAHEFVFHDYATVALEESIAEEPPSDTWIGDPEIEIERVAKRYGPSGIAGVISTDDYPGSTLASIVSHRFRLPGVPVGADLLCQHKYHGRGAQRQFAPEAVPAFELLDETGSGVMMPFPVFIKPVKSFFSVGASRVDSAEALPELARRAELPDRFYQPFAQLLTRYAGFELGTRRVLVEAFLKGRQVSLDGYACGGDVHVIGLVDAIMFPDTTSFQRFEYPSRLPASIQDRMGEVAKKVIQGIGFDNGLFNIEFIYNAAADAVHIVEINPRMSSQFADLIEKVDGTNTYSILLDIALGKKPILTRREGAHAMAASCVLRVFDNRRVRKLPDVGEIAELRTRHPDMRVEILA
ncbi:MAG: ATP-grasp domain-containing protein, partial [Casimicrobiaceae bacterium]